MMWLQLLMSCVSLLITHLKHVSILEPSVFRGRVGVNLTVKDDPVPLAARHLAHLRLHQLRPV